MEEDYKRILERHRDKFRESISIERLSSSLLVSHILSDADWQTIENEPNQRVDRLLDILKTKGYDKFKRFCVILETTYPYMLNCMFLGMEPPKNMFAGTSGRISKNNNSKHAERGNEPRQTGNVHRSVSMIEHDSCKDTTSLRTELRVIQRKYDNVVQKLHKMEKDRNLGEPGQKDDQQDTNRTLHENKENEYESLKQKYEETLKELQLQTRQSEDLAEKYSTQMIESEHFRNLHLVGLNKCDQLVREAQMLNQKLNSSESERSKLQQDYEEIILLREQEKNNYNTQNNVPGKGYDSLKTMYEKLRLEYQLSFDEYQRLQTRFSENREQLNGVTKKLESSENERAYFKQQYSVMKRNYEKCTHEKEFIVNRVYKAEQHRDAAVKETDQAMALQLKTTRELTKLKEERNSALAEYRLVMSERDGVHKEIDKLQEDLIQDKKETSKMKEELERVVEEKETISHDLSIVGNERDRAMKELYLVKQRTKQIVAREEELIKQKERASEECEMYREERDAARRERHEAIIHRDKILRECFEVKQRNETFKGESKESENLRKQFDALSKELANALSEAEVSKKRRDWSFSERDKMVKERDAVKGTCDVLRQERDRAVSDLAALLRDTDQIRREQNKSIEELKSLKEVIEMNLESDPREGLVSSIDSAIDTHSNTDWETELVVFDKGNSAENLGFDIATSKSSIVVTNVAKGSLADGKLRVNDCVLRVNNVDVSSMKYEKAVEAFKEGDALNLTVKRRKLPSMNKPYLLQIHVNVPRGKELGILIDPNKYISWIKPGSVADHEQRLTVGDRIISVNGNVVSTLSEAEAEDLLNSSALVLEVQKANSTTRSHLLQSLLVEVDERIKQGSSIRQKVEYKEAMLADSLSALQGSEKMGTSELSSAVQSEVDESGSINGNSSLFMNAPHLNMSPSLTPLYEDKEQTQATQTDSCSTLPISTDGGTQRRRISISEKSDGHRSSSSYGPSPPPRVSSVQKRHNPPTGQRNRPKSAPVARPDTLDVTMANNRVVHSGDSTLPRTSIIHPPISPSDPLSLSPRVNHLSGRPQPISPPAFNSLFRLRNVAHFTVHSRPLLPGPAVSEFCMPTSCPTNDASRSSLPEGGDKASSDFRARTWTDPPKNFRNRRALLNGGSLPLQKNAKESGSLSLPTRRRIKSTSSQSYNTTDTHSTISSHSSCERSTGSMGSSGQNTPRITPSTPTFPHNIIHHEPIVQHVSVEGDDRSEKIRKIHIEKSSYPLGIQIAQGSSGGIFVTAVTEGSIAQKAGLRYGDQILEFNGINFRSANYSQAAIILSQSACSVCILVQYNPQKLKENVMDTAASYNSSQGSINVGDSDITPPVPRKFVPTNDVEAPGEPRFLSSNKPLQGPGMNILGGNATGIFVSECQDRSIGLQVGDQILEFNGVDFTSVTLEQATLELCKPTDRITIKAQYNSARYNVIKDHPGDSLYVRAMFDRPAANKDELSFKKDDILYITDTLYNGHMGCWKAWVVNKEDAQQRDCGMVPSRMKAEQIILLRMSIAQGDQEHKLAGRRSFFRRSKKGNHSYTVSHSRESSDSAASISTFTESGGASYQTVERLDTHHPRPVIIMGPLANIVSKKLAMEAPYKFTSCHRQIVSASEADVKKAVSEGVYLDYVIKDGQPHVTCMTAIKEDMEKAKHSILEVSPLAIQKLKSQRVYPIVLFLKYKSPKHIKEQRDNKYLQQKLTTKEARALYENSVKTEYEFKSEFNAVIPGTSINGLFSQLQVVVDEQQKKTLWVPVSTE